MSALPGFKMTSKGHGSLIFEIDGYKFESWLCLDEAIEEASYYLHSKNEIRQLLIEKEVK